MVGWFHVAQPSRETIDRPDEERIQYPYITATKYPREDGAAELLSRRIKMAKLRHLAIKTHDPEKLANFYKTVFDMKEVVRGTRGSIHLSDGVMSLAIQSASEKSKEPQHPAGFYHIGFQVDDLEDIAQRIRQIHPEGAPAVRGARWAETRGKDPDGNLFDVSVGGWETEPKSK
jgi:catechol 2,3-dioxygenase-like lactoylglutathione lyase family enzyme